MITWPVFLALMAASLGLVVWCLFRYQTALFLVLLSPWTAAVFIPNNPAGEQYEGIGSYLRMGLLVLIGVSGLLYCFRQRVSLPWPFVLLGAYLVLAVVSTLYSIDPFYTLVRAVALLALSGFLLGLFAWLDRRERIDAVLNVFFTVVGVVTTANLLSLVFLPGEAWWWIDPDRFQGLSDHPNSMGSFCMLSYPVLLWKYSRSKTGAEKLAVLSLAVSVVGLHLLSGSRASMVGGLLGIAVWFLVLRKGSRLVIAGMLALALVGMFPFFGEKLQLSSLDRGRHSSGITDLTGRPKFWMASLVLVSEQPVLGYGYAVEGKVWTDRRFRRSDHYLWAGTAKSSLHNGYLSVAIGLGGVGLALWLSLVLIPAWGVRKVEVGEPKAFVAAILIMALLVNFVESSLSGSRSAVTILFWIAWVLALRLTPGTFFSLQEAHEAA